MSSHLSNFLLFELARLPLFFSRRFQIESDGPNGAHQPLAERQRSESAACAGWAACFRGVGAGWVGKVWRSWRRRGRLVGGPVAVWSVGCAVGETVAVHAASRTQNARQGVRMRWVIGSSDVAYDLHVDVEDGQPHVRTTADRAVHARRVEGSRPARLESIDVHTRNRQNPSVRG